MLRYLQRVNFALPPVSRGWASPDSSIWICVGEERTVHGVDEIFHVRGGHFVRVGRCGTETVGKPAEARNPVPMFGALIPAHSVKHHRLILVTTTKTDGLTVRWGSYTSEASAARADSRSARSKVVCTVNPTAAFADFARMIQLPFCSQRVL